MHIRLPLLSLAFSVAASLSAQPGGAINQTDAQGMKQGTWRKNWAETEQPRYQGTFKNDKPVGRFLYFNQRGKIESQVDHYSTGNGAHARHFHPNAKLMAEGRYAGEAKDSVWNYYNDAGVLLSTERWKDGKKDGEQISYFADGKIGEQTSYLAGVQHGPAKKFFPGGQLQSTAVYAHGEPEGTMTWFYPNGKKEIEGKTVNGDRDGTWFYYNDDGTIQIQVVYAKGEFVKDRKENGVFKEYYEDDQLKSEVTWKNGKKEGPFSEYFDNGKWVVEPLKLGPEGGEVAEQERKLEGQTKKREGSYTNDALDGVVKEYDEKGRQTGSVTYTNGTPTP